MRIEVRCERFQTADGLQLVRRHWTPPEPTRVVALVHGLAEHSERYDATARWLGEVGYSVHAYDQRGHGESEGPRMHAPSFEILLDDLERHLEIVRQHEPQLPLILLGHSMGGLEVAALLGWRKPELAAAVLSGPTLLPSSRLGPATLKLASLIASALPRLRVSTGIPPEGLSRDPAVVEAYIKDPRIDQQITLRLATQLMRAVPRVRASAAAIEVPILIVHGEDDPLCDVRGSRQFHAELNPALRSLRTYPGLLHEVLNEPEREQVLTEIHTWIQMHVPLDASR